MCGSGKGCWFSADFHGRKELRNQLKMTLNINSRPDEWFWILVSQVFVVTQWTSRGKIRSWPVRRLYIVCVCIFVWSQNNATTQCINAYDGKYEMKWQGRPAVHSCSSIPAVSNNTYTKHGVFWGCTSTQQEDKAWFWKRNYIIQQPMCCLSRKMSAVVCQ